MDRKTHWERIGWRQEVLVETETGRVVGRVVGEWRTWSAYADVRPLGDYLTMGQAKAAAVEAQSLTHEAPNGK